MGAPLSVRLGAAALVIAGVLGPTPARAQTSNFALVDTASDVRPPGWTFTPTLVFQTAADDNVLLRGTGDEAPGDVTGIIEPRGTLSFVGRRSEFNVTYDGAFSRYRDLGELDSFDQHATASVRRHLAPHVVVFASNAFASLPTTELVNLVAVPFFRTGSTLDIMQGGVEAGLTKYTSVTATVRYQWVSFDQTADPSPFLQGGQDRGATASLKRMLSDRLAVIGTYSIDHASLVDGGTFDIQNGDVGIEYRITAQTSVMAAGGFSHLVVSDFDLTRTGPELRAGITHHYQRITLGAGYSRSYVPAFGFGGTYQNEEIDGHVSAPIARRVYTESSVAWRRNEPLTEGALLLHSVWVQGVVGYELQPWLHLEAFYAGEHQAIDQPGGLVSRNRVGFQIVTTKPMRIR